MLILECCCLCKHTDCQFIAKNSTSLPPVSISQWLLPGYGELREQPTNHHGRRAQFHRIHHPAAAGHWSRQPLHGDPETQSSGHPEPPNYEGTPAQQSSCETDISAGRTRQGSDEDVGMVRCGFNQTCDNQQLSETLSSLSLTSLLLPSSLAPPSVKKCNSTGSLDHGTLATQEKVFIKEPQGKITSPWKKSREARRESQSEAAQGKDGESTSQITIVGSRRNRWNFT